jgi:hypothetical protein
MFFAKIGNMLQETQKVIAKDKSGARSRDKNSLQPYIVLSVACTML